MLLAAIMILIYRKNYMPEKSKNSFSEKTSL